jgi:enamine deaminase RidA (YjgF/YER057c/UK114 family)
MSATPSATGEPTQNLSSLQASLPTPPLPIGSYVAAVQVGNLLYTSGILPMQDGQVAYTGAVGGWGVPVEKGREAAHLAMLNALSVVNHTLGDLHRVKRVVKVTGFVSSAPGFFEQPAVMNGASDLLVEVFGDAGKHARSAVGVLALPRDASVEVELVVEIQA